MTDDVTDDVTGLDPLADVQARLRLLNLWRLWRDSQERIGPRIKQWLELLLQLYPPPNFSDEADTRVWFRRVAGVADQVADLTSTEIDDQAAKVLHVIVESDPVWTAFYNLFLSMVPHAVPLSDSGLNQRADAICDRIGPLGDVPLADALLILAIAKGMAAFIDFIREEKYCESK